MSDWTDLAACKDQPPSWFFPSPGEAHHEAKAVCAQCDVTEECLEFALLNHEQHGVWGGLTPGERQRLEDGARMRTKHCQYCARPYKFFWEGGRMPVFCSERCRREAHLKSHRESHRRAVG